MRRLSVILFATLAGLLLASDRSSAQTLSELLPGLYEDVIVPQYTAFVFVTGVEPQIKGLENATHITRLLAHQLSSFPLVSPSAGIAVIEDPGAITGFSRASASLGPVYGDRAVTIGRKRLNFGANYQRITFDHLDGKSLKGGEIVSYTGAPNIVGNIGIFFADAVDLKVTTETMTTFATYGVTDRFDVGIAVPLSHVEMRASITARLGTTDPRVELTDSPTVTSRSGSASGIGDVVVRTKYNVFMGNGAGVAQVIEVRLPTGDERNLLGVAGPQMKLAVIASATAGRVSPHVNFGYTVSGRSTVADDPESPLIGPPGEINYAVGADVAMSLRTSFAVDVVGRSLRRGGTLTHGPTVFGSDFPEFQFNPDAHLNLLLGSVGVKVNPFANLVVTANVLTPLSKRGLTDKFSLMAGFDYSF